MKKRKKFLPELPRTDGMIRLLSFLTAVLILAIPLSMRRIFRPLPVKNTDGLNLELICWNKPDIAGEKRWAQLHDPEDLFAFSRSPEKKYRKTAEKYRTGSSLHAPLAAEKPASHTLAVAELPERSISRSVLRIGAIPHFPQRSEYETPGLKELEVCNGSGGGIGMSIDPVPFRGNAPRPVLFRLHVGKYGKDLRLLHSSGDRSFDAGVRRKLLQKEIGGTAGGLFCVWPQVALKEKNL